jgi:hypothetical protein
MDPFGMAGFPHATRILCKRGSNYSVRGVASGSGGLHFWLVEGELTFNGEAKRLIGSSFWASEGAFVDLTVRGMVFVIGAPLLLDDSIQEYVFTSSYSAPKTRSYDLEDARAHRSNAALMHDHHINNGTSNSMDFIFGSPDGVTPPVVTVLNCANGSEPATNFVWSHFHPFGAVYVPFSGNICFSSDKTRCSEPGEIRWTSSLLQYYEWFVKPVRASGPADAVRELAGVSPTGCERPVVFGVTNFDGPAGRPGVPNFDDWPREAHGKTSSAGIGPWGFFDTMVIRSTTVVTKSVTLRKADSYDRWVV